MSEATNTNTATDARLLALLADSRAAEDAHDVAARADDDAGVAAALARLEAVLGAMANTPAAGWVGVAVKAARLCRSLRDGGDQFDGFGDSVTVDDVPVAESLAADLARLAPGVRA
ncbi:hypothetical protein AAFN86_11660 [Roseomonas sp. CAU 1739]|uniref:hypothetical protein n=1 Tax=Roseomonas sp. CAU 1739 TaxID=3140364 RepID=UPI00325A4C99